MSGKASIAAAQKRRAAPQQVAKPAPSISSAHLFAQQQTNPRVPVPTHGGVNAPNARIAGQHAQYQQNNMMQQQYQQQMEDHSSRQSNGKLTIAQAITLLSLRVGRLETQMHAVMEEGLTGGHQQQMSDFGDNDFGTGSDNSKTIVDSALLNTILSRLESLEKRPVSAPTSGLTPSVGASLDVKQNIELLKNNMVTLKNGITSVMKDGKETKTTVEGLQMEIESVKQLLAELQNTVVDHSIRLSKEGTDVDLTTALGDNAVFTEEDFANMNLEYDPNFIPDMGQTSTTDLKAMIEKELNGTI